LRLYGSKKAAFITSLIITCFPFLVIEAPRILSDTLALIFFSLWLWFFLSPSTISKALEGIILAILTLTRPSYLIIALLYPFHYFSSKMRSIKHLLPLLFLVLTLLPWFAYTYHLHGAPVITTELGVVLYVGNYPNTSGRNPIFSSPQSSLPVHAGEFEVHKEGIRRTFKFWITEPITSLLILIKKLLLLLLFPQRMLSFTFPLLLYFSLLNGSWVILEIIGIIALLREKNSFFFSLLLLLYLPSIICIVSDRYTLPMVFVYSILAGNLISKLKVRLSIS